MGTKSEAILTFVRYLSWSELMRRSYEAELTRTDAAGPESNSAEWPLFGWHCYAYASLNVVVEAWEDSRFEDPIIDQLLAHSRGYRDLLRRFRNAVFHHQRDFTDSRFIGLLWEGEEAVLWITALQDEFKRFVQNRLNNLIGTPDELMEVRQRLRDLLGWLPGEPDELRGLKEELARATRLLSSHPQDRMVESHARDLALAVSAGSQALTAGLQLLENFRRDRLRRLGVVMEDGG